jgi:UDP-glucose 4-epimerase
MKLARSGKVAVVGASGLLGQALTTLLVSQGREVVAFVRPEKVASCLASANIKFIGLDLESNFDIRENLLDGVAEIVYLAQSPFHNTFPRGAGSVSALNVVAPHRLAEQATECGVSRFIFASSGGIAQAKEVNESTGVNLISDSAPIREDQMGFYLTTKAQTEQSLSYFAPSLSICNIRYFFIYGPEQRAEMLIPRMINSVVERKTIKLGQNRGPLLNPIYVNDAALATSLVLGSDLQCSINVAGNEIQSLKQICETIAGVTGVEPIFENIDDAPVDFVASTEMLNGLGMECEFNLSIGIENTFRSSGLVGSL